MIYSFLICSSIERNKGIISSANWNFLLRGADIYDKTDQPQNPISKFIKEPSWNLAYAFELANKERLEGFCQSIIEKSQSWIDYCQSDDPID